MALFSLVVTRLWDASATGGYMARNSPPYLDLGLLRGDNV